MTQFIGGPYDGQDLPANPQTVERIALPDPETTKGMFLETVVKQSSTNTEDWPHKYELDRSVDPPVYRHVSQWSAVAQLDAKSGRLLREFITTCQGDDVIACWQAAHRLLSPFRRDSLDRAVRISLAAEKLLDQLPEDEIEFLLKGLG